MIEVGIEPTIFWFVARRLAIGPPDHAMFWNLVKGFIRALRALVFVDQVQNNQLFKNMEVKKETQVEYEPAKQVPKKLYDVSFSNNAFCASFIFNIGWT